MTGPVTMSDLDGHGRRLRGGAPLRPLHQPSRQSCWLCLGAAVLAGWAWQVEPLISLLPARRDAAQLGRVPGRPRGVVVVRPFGRRHGGAGSAPVCDARATDHRGERGPGVLSWRRTRGGPTVVRLRPALVVQPYPGRMAPHTAVGLLLLSVAQMVLPGPMDPPGRRVVASQILALSASALGLLGLYGYVYNVPEFVSPFGVTAMAVHTAIALTVGAIAVFVTRPTSGPARILTTRAKTAMLTRWILLMTLLVLPLLGWLGLIGESRGVYGIQFGVALLVAANGATFTVVTFITGARAARLESSCREAEAALAWHSAAAAMVEAAPDAMVGVDARGLIVLVNAQAEQLFGYPRKDMIGRSAELFVPEAARSIHAVHLRGSGVREPVLHTALRVRRRDSTEIPVEIRLSTIDTGGQRLVIAAVHDVTERVRYETQLRAKNSQLQRAGQAKDAFLAAMSHELRTPLNSIIGFTGTLLMGLPGPLTDEQTEQLRLVETTSLHLLSLIDDILQFAKIKAGQLEVDLQSIDCNAVLREVADYLRPLADHKDIPLIVELPEPNCVATVDRRALSQILINLIGNAIKFTDVGEVRVTLACERPDQPWTVTISDTGPGVHPDEQARIFNAFHRAGDARTRSHDGAGLGLYISQTLAERMDCSIQVTSAPGDGATFALTGSQHSRTAMRSLASSGG